ncbi:DMT family transporter [Aureimonas sp. AU22]|uniref:DMT family transporter n=1 Tax=Aureimonas sp. AU22 TaxID=1638162 RepID=UPI0007836E99|nr:DMT family transporter [Aureimonas sp. AU22]
MTVPTPARLSATLLGVCGILLWATETVLITFTTRIPPLQTVALAFVFAALMAPLAWRLTGDDPRAAFRQPPRVWLLVVGSLVGYHAAIYWATQQAPPAAAALLQGTTPLLIVLGSALLPGERLRAWHVAGAIVGLVGILLLIDGGEAITDDGGARAPAFYLSLIGVAAGLWGLYSVLSRRYADVPTSALGVFYAASAVICVLLHASLETWVAPTPGEWAAIAALGVFPMGLALYLWDVGVKHGDIQALGAISYVEPFIGALLVAFLGQGQLDARLAVSGLLVILGALLASCNLLRTAPIPQASAVASDAAMLDDLRRDLVSATERCLRKLEQTPPVVAADEREMIAGRLLALWRSMDALCADDRLTPRRWEADGRGNL